MGLQFFPEPAQVENRVDAPEQVIGGNTVVEIKCIEKSILPIDRWSHHRHFSNPNTQIRESHLDSYLNHLFNTLGQCLQSDIIGRRAPRYASHARR